MARYYYTTTLPYVNAQPHIGTALEFVQADALARFRRLQGHEVFFNVGTDEHGQKIYEKAVAAGHTPQEYVDGYAEKFEELREVLNLSYDAFIRTTDPKHMAAAQEFWRRCAAAGDIYKKNYQVKYCVGCELEKSDSELEDGKCPIHPTYDIEFRDEENYFFRFSKYNDALLALYKENKEFVLPRTRLNEMISLIEREGFKDFSISRLKEKMPWGIPVPGDEDHVMYVWFDALINYISTIGWPASAKAPAGTGTVEGDFEKWWPVVQFAGKDQVRQQAAMWQAMLLSAGLPPSKQIFIHGFINVNGQKVSKSVGNTIHPAEVTNAYGTDALRYYYLRHTHPFEDSDYTKERFEEAYTANLVNGIGNLTSRIMKLAEQHLESPIERPEPEQFPEEYSEAFNSFEFNKAADFVWRKIQTLDERIAEEEPFKVVKEDKERGERMIYALVCDLYTVGRLLQPLMPHTSDRIKEAVLQNKKPENLFPRLP